MRYGSVCSGVEAASLAWEPLGWQPQWFSEIEAFPSAVLQHHWPDVANLGDMTSEYFRNNTTSVDLLVGGTPCQSFSIAGLREGLDDERGNLALEFCRIVDRLTPRWVVWENVPGVLSSNGGRDFGTIVGAMAEIGYNVAWRILDAQHYGTPQRRRRIFLVGHLGADERGATAVLLESHSLQGHSPPSREKGKNVAAYTSSSIGGYSERVGGYVNEASEALVSKCITAGIGQRYDFETETFPIVSRMQSMRARRLTPRECERLQGMPDDHTRIPWRGKSSEDCPDAPRYKAIGNSMAVPVMRWIGERIQMVDNILNRGGSNDGQHI